MPEERALARRLGRLRGWVRRRKGASRMASSIGRRARSGRLVRLRLRQRPWLRKPGWWPALLMALRIRRAPRVDRSPTRLPRPLGGTAPATVTHVVERFRPRQGDRRVAAAVRQAGSRLAVKPPLGRRPSAVVRETVRHRQSVVERLLAERLNQIVRHDSRRLVIVQQRTAARVTPPLPSVPRQMAPAVVAPPVAAAPVAPVAAPTTGSPPQRLVPDGKRVTLAAPELSQLADAVLRRIERRAIAQRERLGRI